MTLRVGDPMPVGDPIRRRTHLLAMVVAAVSVGIVLATVAVLSGAVFGDGSGAGTTNGLAGRRADEVVRAAVDALAHAPGVRVTGTKVDLGRPVAFDTRYGTTRDGEDTCDALLYLSGGTGRFRRVGGETFGQMDAGAFGVLGYPDAMPVAGRWLVIPPSLNGYLTGPDELTLDWWTDSIDVPVLRDGTVRTSRLHRREVVEVRGTDGSKLFVSADGPAYPLRLERADANEIRADFSDYGAVVPVERPPDALDIGQFLPSPGPVPRGTASPSPSPSPSPASPLPPVVPWPASPLPPLAPPSTLPLPSSPPPSPAPLAPGPGGTGVEGR